MDEWLLGEFPGDEELVEEALVARVQWGRFAAGRRLVDGSGASEETRQRLMARLGGGAAGVADSGARVPFEAAVSRTLALHASGDVDGLRALLRRVDLGGVDGLLGQVDRIRTHVGNKALLVEGLGGAHGVAGRQPQLTVGLLLQGGGGKRWRRLRAG